MYVMHLWALSCRSNQCFAHDFSTSVTKILSVLYLW